MMAALALIGRDNARTPMQWDASRYAGFTAPDAATEPWIGVNPNHVEINAAEEFDDPGSVYSFYKKLIAMRHNNATIATGEWNLVAADSEQVYSFTRTSGDDTILVIVNLTDRTAQVPAEVAQLLEDGVGESQVLLSTYDAVHSVKSVARGELARWGGGRDLALIDLSYKLSAKAFVRFITGSYERFFFICIVIYQIMYCDYS